MSWNKLYELGNALESAALSFVVRAGPWLGPIPTAYLVYERTQRHLGWPREIAIAAGLTLECLGLATIYTALQLRNYNRSRPRKTDPPAPMALPLILSGVYFVAAESLTVVLDVAALPASQIGAANLAPALFPVLSLVAVIVLALRADHEYRLDEIAEAVENRRKERAKRREEEREERERLAQIAAEQAQAEVIAEEMPKVKAGIAEWREILTQSNGGFAEADAALVADTLESRGFALPSQRTLQNWALEAKKGIAKRTAPRPSTRGQRRGEPGEAPRR
jgi:hypothetical protein